MTEGRVLAWQTEQTITDDLEALLSVLPAHIAEPVAAMPDRSDLLEIVMDLGRLPEARFPGREVILSEREVTHADLEYVVSRIGEFGLDNRAGIERTLHRISAIRNRSGRIIGLTCRVGRAVYGTINIIRDLVETGKSILLLGRPGVGKTTMLREVARVLADEFRKRVIVVDTSNEIAGDGDIPHPGIGRARRMQVARPDQQHAVMIEAVENHMPEVIVIDEIGTDLEAQAARTIAERGVQLVATAHGNTLENLMLNPTLSDLIGGIQSVTLSDEEARRRGTQKTVLERKAPPTFNILVEIQDWHRVAVHPDVALTVDAILRGQPAAPEIRWRDEEGRIHIERPSPAPTRFEGRVAVPGHRAPEAPRLSPTGPQPPRPEQPPQRQIKIYPFGVSRDKLEQAINNLGVPGVIVKNPQQADAVITVKNYYRRRPQALAAAETQGVPIYVLKSNTLVQIQRIVADIFQLPQENNPVDQALQEAEEAARKVLERSEPVELSPQVAYIRKLQHEIAERYNIASRSEGREPFRRVKFYPPEG
jgi:stage III sporulation protein SpoIIIAA